MRIAVNVQPQLPIPVSNELHLWLGLSGDALPKLSDLNCFLSDEEKRRRDAFKFREHSECFVIARGLLRFLIAQYLGIPPTEVELAYGVRGKPHLAPAQSVSGLRFNLAHSRRAMIFAITSGMEVGVDVEWLDYDLGVERPARTVLRAEETAMLRQQAAAEKTRLFFRYWTQKEAYLKGLGLGLTGDMQSVELRFLQGRTDSVLIDHEPRRDSAGWTVHEFEFADDFAAAVAVQCKTPLLVRRHLGDVL
jgi:4'-phosphopantetheinyl transferase